MPHDWDPLTSRCRLCNLGEFEYFDGWTFDCSGARAARDILLSDRRVIDADLNEIVQETSLLRAKQTKRIA